MPLRRTLVVLTGLALIATTLLTPAGADAATGYRNPPSKSHRIKRPGAKHQVLVHGFRHHFWNYDEDTGKRYVDNPVTLVFISRSPDMVDRVYRQLGRVGISGSGGPMLLGGYGGSRPGVSTTDSWHSTSHGRKGAFGCWGHCGSRTDIHVRTYGPDGRRGTQVYQGDVGYAPYYLVATVHFDVDENTSKATFGYQDRARSLLVSHLAAKHLWHVRASVTVPGSSCYGWFDSHHYCDSNGKAEVISID